MITLRDHHDGELFDPHGLLGPHRRRLLEQSWAGVFRQHLLQHLPVDLRARYLQENLITYVAVGPMNTHDSSALQPALAEATQRGIAPERLLADSQYGSDGNLHHAEAQQVELVSPAMPPKGSKQEKLTLERFELDEQGLIVRCPEGQMPVSRSAGADKLQVLFAESACRACPWQQDCCASAVSRKEPRYQYTQDRVRQRARRLRDRTPEFRERYRWRAGIEATMSRYKHQLGMGQLRVRGLKAVRYTAFLRALGLNIHRVARHRMAG